MPLPRRGRRISRASTRWPRPCWRCRANWIPRPPSRACWTPRPCSTACWSACTPMRICATTKTPPRTRTRDARRASALAMPRSPPSARGSPRNCCRIRRRRSAHGWRRPSWQNCRRTLLKVLRNKPHVLSTAEETLLARAGEVLSASEQTYSLLTNADMAFPDIPGPGGEALALTEGTYRSHLENPDRGGAQGGVRDAAGHLREIAEHARLDAVCHGEGARLHGAGAPFPVGAGGRAVRRPGSRGGLRRTDRGHACGAAAVPPLSGPAQARAGPAGPGHVRPLRAAGALVLGKGADGPGPRMGAGGLPSARRGVRRRPCKRPFRRAGSTGPRTRASAPAPIPAAATTARPICC